MPSDKTPWAGCHTLLIHPGAMGDGILVWPLLRALAARGEQPAWATGRSRAELASSVLGVRAVDIENPILNALWRPADLARAGFEDRALARVIVFMADGESAAERSFRSRLSSAFPRATVQFVGPPGSPSRAECWRTFDVARAGSAAPSLNPAGPLLVHAGAGGAAKAIPITVLQRIVKALTERSIPNIVIGGEAERERWARFPLSGGLDLPPIRLLSTLTDLLSLTRDARAFVGADSGPTHLAAQLGIPMLALFGPTDPAIWQQVGPLARTLAPDVPAPMDWLLTSAGAAALDRSLATLVSEAAGAP
ncbi:MAG: glycosyltransferase family 9 protein [Phycisphaerales bacterium]